MRAVGFSVIDFLVQSQWDYPRTVYQRCSSRDLSPAEEGSLKLWRIAAFLLLGGGRCSRGIQDDQKGSERAQTPKVLEVGKGVPLRGPGEETRRSTLPKAFGEMRGKGNG